MTLGLWVSVIIGDHDAVLRVMVVVADGVRVAMNRVLLLVLASVKVGQRGAAAIAVLNEGTLSRSGAISSP